MNETSTNCITKIIDFSIFLIRESLFLLRPSSHMLWFIGFATCLPVILALLSFTARFYFVAGKKLRKISFQFDFKWVFM